MSVWKCSIRINQLMRTACRYRSLSASSIRGSVTDVTAAVEAGMEVANRMTGVVQHYIIPNPEEGTEKMLKISALDKQ